MPRKPSAERLAEFQTYLSFFRAMWAFQEKVQPGLRALSATPDGTPYGEWASTFASKAVADGSVRFSELLTGMKQGVADQLEMTRDLPLESVKAADEFLVAAGALRLTEMRCRVWRVIPRVLARGRIRNIDEFYVVKNVVSDDGEGLSAKERARLARMMFDFESRSKRDPTPPATSRRS